MADRSLVVRLEAAVDQYRRDMESAAKSTRDVGKASEDASRQVVGSQDKSRRSVAQFARDNEQAFKAVESTGRWATTRITAPIVALGTAVGVTGVSYNALEQRSRAALTTILGSAEAATKQMDELVAFGRTSPFPRQVWIEAQQQLLGFGMEAERVVPILGAVQDAVAATGGTSQDIAEIVDVLARIQGQGRITGVELQRLGIRGIDAAGILAEHFGVTGDEIRSRISAGAIDAESALDALVVGINDRMGGAAQNMRETWDGAVDRVKGAFRDLSSAIVEPFVTTTGGGSAVDAANAFADSLRTLEAAYRNLEPAQQTAVVSTAALVAGVGPALWGIGRLGRAVISTAENFREMRPAIRRVATFLTGPWGIAVTAATAAVTAWSTAQVATAGRQREFRDTLDETTGAITEQTRALVARRLEEGNSSWNPFQTTWAGDSLDQLRNLGMSMSLVIDAASGSGPAMDEFNRQIDAMGVAFAESGDFTAGFTAEQLNAIDAVAKLNSENREAAEAQRQLAEAIALAEAEQARAEAGLDGHTNAMFNVGAATRHAASETDEFGNEVDTAGGQVEDTRTELEKLVDELGEYLEATRRATDPVFRLVDALDGVEQAQQAYNDALEKHGKDSREAQDASLNLMRRLGDLEAAALDGDLSFREFSDKLRQWVRDGRITSDQADDIRGRVAEARGEVEKFPERKRLDMELRDERARRQLEAYGRAVDRAARNRTTTVTVSLNDRALRNLGATLGRQYSIAANATRSHSGGYVVPGGVRKFHEGGAVGRYHSGGMAGGVLRSDEVPAILQTGELVLSRRQVSMMQAALAAMPRMHGGAGVEAAPVQGQPISVEVKSIDGNFSTRQVINDLAMHGAV